MPGATHSSPETAGTGSIDAVEVVRALARVSRVLERSSDDISLANYRILAAIASGDQRASRVGAKLALGKPTVSAAVESLCLRGLVSRSTSGTDQRVVTLNLTDAGRVLLDRVEEAMISRVTELCARTPDGARLMEALSWLGPAIDDSLRERTAGGRRSAG